VSFEREAVRRKVAALAEKGVFIGTSSWKYPGWRGMLYDEARYVTRGRFSEARFERECLAEYAEVFKTVCVDGAYYRFPDRRYLDSLRSKVSEDFRFSFKVTDEISIKKFTNLPRFGERAGKPNENFLNAGLFASAFLGPCEAFRANIGLLIFEFSHFYPTDYAHGRDFVAALDQFFGQIPKGWPYGVEIRNKHFLHPDYFAMLARHGVTHVFNSWGSMPSVDEQMALPESRTNPELCGARFLLKPGRKYEEAVKLFSPYVRTKEPNPEAREAGANLIREGLTATQPRKTFIYVNNRLEGNALSTIEAMLEQSGAAA
jgi:uncharacterized protein YecE (DUF72 family)